MPVILCQCTWQIEKQSSPHKDECQKGRGSHSKANWSQCYKTFLPSKLVYLLLASPLLPWSDRLSQAGHFRLTGKYFYSCLMFLVWVKTTLNLYENVFYQGSQTLNIKTLRPLTVRLVPCKQQTIAKIWPQMPQFIQPFCQLLLLLIIK